jgi:hypothetical protein
MKFGKVADARRAIWERVLAEFDHTVDLGVLEDECEDEFDLRRMETAIKQVRASILQRVRRAVA